MACQSIVASGAAPTELSVVIRFSPLVGLPDSLVRKDQKEVCPLSRGVMSPRLNSYPLYYGAAFAFSLLLYPHRYRLALRRVFPLGAIRAYRVPLVCQSGEGPLYPPMTVCPRQGKLESLYRPCTFWFKPVSIFGLLRVTTVVREFTFVDHTTQS